MFPIRNEKPWLQNLRSAIRQSWIVAALTIASFQDASAATANPEWSSLGGMPGTNASVYCSAVDSAGNLYVGGSFTIAGDVQSYGVAKWNGSKWISISPPTNSGQTVEAMAIDAQDNLYVGGSFTDFGGQPALRIAKWDGAKWHAMGAGLGFNGVYASQKVKSIAISKTGEIYAGGFFDASNGVVVNNIARWNGSAWKPLAEGLIASSPEVNALAFDADDNLYATGKFTYTGTTPINYIAKWNGNKWSNLGTGLGGFPYEATGKALKFDADGNLVVAGIFKTAGLLQVNNIARWDGNSWSAFGTAGVDAGFEALSDGIYALGLTPNGAIVAASRGAIIDNTVRYEVVRWNGKEWVAAIPHPAVMGLIRTLQIMPNGDYVLGGDFKELGLGADAFHASRLVRWTGKNFRRFGDGPDGRILASKFDTNGDLIVAGSFQTIGNIEANRIARFDGKKWWPYGTGLDGEVFSVALGKSGQLYAGGKFNRAGSVDSKCVAKWNGTQWVSLAGGVTQIGTVPVVNALALASDGTLYAGGEFGLSASNVALSGVGRWKDGVWKSLDGGARTIDGTQRNGRIVSLIIDAEGRLLASGYFERMGSNTKTNTGYLARWNGKSWTPVGPSSPSARPFDNYRGIESMGVSPDGTIYVGINESINGAHAVRRLVSNAWQPMGKGFNGRPHCFAFDNEGGVYVGGILTEAGVTYEALRGITYWNGKRWTSFGYYGLDLSTYLADVTTLAMDGKGSMFLGGDFWGSHNGVVSPYLIQSRVPGFSASLPTLSSFEAAKSVYQKSSVAHESQSLTEYVATLDPLSEDPEDAPHLSLTVGGRSKSDEVVTGFTPETLKFRYRRNRLATGNATQVMASPDLREWKPAKIVSTQILEQHSQWELIEVTLPKSKENQFLRLASDDDL